MARAGFCHELRNKNERFWTFEKACWSIPRAHHYSITPLSQVHLLSLLEHTVLLQWQDLIFSPADWYSQRCREHHHAQNLVCVRNRGRKGGREREYWWETGGEKWLLLCCQTVSKPTLASLSGDEPHTEAEAWQTLKIYSCFPKSSSCSFRVKTFFFFLRMTTLKSFSASNFAWTSFVFTKASGSWEQRRNLFRFSYEFLVAPRFLRLWHCTSLVKSFWSLLKL